MSLEIFNYDKDTKFDINLSLLKNLNSENFLIKLSEGLGIIGPKLDKYYNHLSCISANLILLFLNKKGEYVFYSRDNNYYKKIKRYNPLSISVRKITKIINLLIKYKFVEHRKGRHMRHSKEPSYRSRIKPTANFLNLIKNNPINREDIKVFEPEVIILKNSRKDLKDYVDNDEIDEIRQDCLRYNNNLNQTIISLTNNKIVDEYQVNNDIKFENKNYYRVFNQNFKNGGRFYGPWWLGIPSELRQYITINNNKTAEYDYSSLIIHQIYSEVGLNYFEENTYSDDPYLLKGVPDTERKINKAIIQIGLNCDDLDSLNKALLSQYKKGKLIGNKPKKKEIERRLNIFKEMNPKISDYVYSKCALRFQYQDSEIVRKIVNRCSKYLIPVLSVHDSFIVEETNSNFIIDTMNSAIKDTRLTSIPSIK